MKSLWLPLFFLSTVSLTAQTPASSPASDKPDWFTTLYRLPEFPKPGPEKVFAELKILQPDGSAYRTPREDWNGARKRVAEDPDWAQWATKRRAEMDRWMSRNHDRAEWVAGWNHDFVSPKDGSFLIWNEDIPGEEVAFFTSRSGDRVEITPKLLNAWVGAFRKQHADKLAEAARFFHLTSEPRYAEWVAGQLDFYANNYEKWPRQGTKTTPARLGYQSLDDAVIVSRLVDAARLLFGWAAPERRQLWFEKLFKPEAELLDQSFQRIHNIATWQRATQAQIALLYGDEKMWDRAVESDFGLRAQIRRGVTSDYFWFEQSMGYNSFIVKATEPLLTFAGLIGQGSRLHQEAAIVQNLMLAPIMIRFPNKMVPNPADNTGIPKAPSPTDSYCYRIFPTPMGVVRATQTKSWDTLVDPASPEAAPAKIPKVTSRNMESTRFAVIKKGPWQLFFHYGQLNPSHAQSEALNWSASFEGMDFSHDPGTVGYGSPLHKGYYQRGLGQNVPLVNGEGQAPWNPGKLLSFDADAAVVSAEQPYYRSDATARRTLHINGDSLIDEVTVTSTSEDPAKSAQLGLALHLQGKPRLSSEFKAIPNETFAQNRPEPFRYWKEIRSATFKDHAEIEVEFPDDRIIKVQFSTPGIFTIYQGSSPDVPPTRRAGFYLEKQGKEATFVTKFTPLTPEEEAPLKTRGN